MKSQVSVLIGVLAIAACGKHPVAPTGPSSRPLTESQETDSYSFRYAPGDTVDASRQEAFHRWAVATLEVQMLQRVTYNKFLSRAHMGDVTGHASTNGYAEPSTFTIFTIWPMDNHEAVHVLSALFGTPPALFNEGVAVALQTDPLRGDFVPRWNGTPLHEWARTFRRQGTLVELGRLLASSDFRRLDPNVTYPEAGSFVRFLLDRHGLETLKRLFRDVGYSESAVSVRQRFEATYGSTIEDAERAWWAMLDRP